MRKFYLIIAILISFNQIVISQETSNSETDSTGMEIYLIDAYVKPDSPYIFVLSFYTSKTCLSNVIIDGKYEFVVSNGLSEAHSAKIDLTGLKFLNKNVPFFIATIDSLGNKFTSEEYEFDLPYEPIIEEGSSLFTLCLFAGSVFLIPAPGYVNMQSDSYFSLTKEIPVISFRSKGINYPASYISIEYTHVFDAPYKNFARLGYKRIFNTGIIEYISPGVTAFTNFSGQNGIAAEVSLGLFTMFDTFTLYTRYRYNLKPGDPDSNFYEINLGFYTRFFSLYF